MTKRYLDRKLKLQMLRAAETIATHGSLVKASVALGTTQPALTKSLRDLEEIIQEPLFERHSRGVRLTVTGERVVRSGRAIMAELLRLDEDLELGLTEGAGIVAVGALPVTAAGVLPGVLTRLQNAHPLLQVRVHEGRMEELLPLLAAREVDLIVGRLYEPLIPDTLLREPLWEEPISILARAGHPIFDGPDPSAETLRLYGILLPTLTQRVGADIDGFFKALELTPTIAVRSNSYGFIREMVVGSDMLAVMPRLLMVGDLLRRTLRVVPLANLAAHRPAGLIVAPDRPLQAGGRLFIECLRAYLAEIADHGLLHIASGYSERQTNDMTPISILL